MTERRWEAKTCADGAEADYLEENLIMYRRSK